MQFRQSFAALSIAGAALAVAALSAGCGGAPEGTNADDGVASTAEALPFHLYFWAWNKNWDLPAAGIHFAPNLQTGPIYNSFAVSQSGAGAAEMFWRDETLSIKHVWPSASGGWSYELLGGTDFGGVGVGRAPNGSMQVVAGVTRKGDTQVYVTQGSTRSGWPRCSARAGCRCPRASCAPRRR